MPSDCVFCKIVHKELPATVVYEDDDCVAIKDIHPKAPIHYLIIPKKHVPKLTELQAGDELLAGKLLLVAKKLSIMSDASSDFRLICNNGAQAGQEVFHMHFHFLAGKAIPPF